MDFAFVQITDHHLQEAEEALLRGYPTARHFQAVLRHLAEHVAADIDFIVSTGDLAQHGADAEYQAICQMLNLQAVSEAPGPQPVSIETLHEFPMYFLPGNHDSRPQFFQHLFPKSLPTTLINASFVHKGVQFICLDWGDQNQAIAQPEMLDFLSQALQTALPIILLMHHQVAPIGVERLDSYIAAEVGQFWNSVAGHNILGIFCGHVHTTYETEMQDIPIFGLRATAFQFDIENDFAPCLYPPHYRLVEIQGGQLSTKIFEVPL